jgi:hypothetical protein
MSTSKLFRLSGLAAIFAGVLLPASWILRFIFDISRPTTGTIEFVATILMIFGFIGVYGFQHEKSGILGFLGFVLIIIHSCCALGECWLQNGEPTAAGTVLAPIVGATMLLGFILFGIGSWQAGQLPRWIPILWVLGGLLIVPGFLTQPVMVVVGGIIQGIGIVAAGVILWMGKYSS